MTKQRQQIEKEIATIAFYMQGGLNYADAFMLSMEQLKNIGDVISDHYEAQNNALNSRKKM